MTLTYAELFAGAGGLSRGLEAAGFHCVAHAEIEPHARAVLRYHWPDTRLDGDVTQINGADYAGITLLSGGSPCQDLSVAGKRAGLAGGRSGLFHEQARIWNESGAPYLLWENVLGALSSNGGKDFAVVLSTLVGATIPVPADGWATGGVAAGRDAVAAWRVLDLQHFGPPQRRVRVFVLAARAGGVDPAEVLALAEGVCGHPSPRQQAREGTTGRTAGGVGAGGVEIAFSTKETGGAASFGVVNTLRAESGDPHMGGRAAVLAFHHTQTPISGDVAPSVGGTTNGMGVVAYSIGSHAGAADADVSNKSHASGGPTSMGIGRELANTIRAGRTQAVAVCTTGDITHALTHEGADASEDGTGRGTPIVAYGNSGMESWRQTETAITRSERDGKGGMTLVMGDSNEAAPVPSESVADAPLFALRDSAHAEAIRHEAGRSERLHAAEVLRPAVHGGGVRREAGEDGPVVDDSAPSCAEDVPVESLHGVREARTHGRASHQRELAGQQAREPDAPVSVVSHQNAPQPGRPRRLTPKEAERLMSWPDEWTRYGTKEDGTVYELSDTARYRLCGNGVGSVCVEWIATRLADAIAAHEPMRAAA